MFRLKLKQLIFFSSPFWIVSGRYRRVSPLSHCGRFSREFLRPPRRSSPASAPIARIAVSPCRNVRNADHTDNMELTASLTRRLAAPWRNRPAITTSLLNRIHFVLLWFTLYRHTHTHTHAHSRVHPDVRNVALSSKIPSPPPAANWSGASSSTRHQRALSTTQLDPSDTHGTNCQKTQIISSWK